jgi:hypothetical protein
MAEYRQFPKVESARFVLTVPPHFLHFCIDQWGKQSPRTQLPVRIPVECRVQTRA